MLPCIVLLEILCLRKRLKLLLKLTRVGAQNAVDNATWDILLDEWQFSGLLASP